jgi:hypothetical protein
MHAAVADQDIVIMHAQEHAMARSGLVPSDYTIMAASADKGLVAMNKWLKRAGYPHAAYSTNISTTIGKLLAAAAAAAAAVAATAQVAGSVH